MKLVRLWILPLLATANVYAAPTPLHEAMEQRRYKKVFALLDQGADIDAQDDQGRTILMYSVFQDSPGHENREIFLKLLLRNPRLDLKDAKGFSVIHYTAMYALEPLTLFLVNRGAAINDREGLTGMTPLMFTAWQSQLIATNGLLRAGADVEAQDNSGNTPLLFAVEQKAPEIVHLLLSRRPNLNHQNRDGETALMRAAASGRTEYMSLLLAQGADPALVDAQGRTYLDYIRSN